ncbi:MAG TPA: cysteine synthase family protein [Polyangia bacterium]|jgi:cysteine synthase|nr:cysteine synthase family protein [Polyangia bacterium]
MTKAPGSILDCIGNTPLVPLRRIGVGLPARVLVKCEQLNPGGSVKDRLAVAIVDDAERRGLIAPGATLVEATAGNTGIGLGLVAAVRGYRLVCVLPEKMSHDKRAALALIGARVVMTPNAPPDHPDNFQVVARRLAAENGWFLTDQFYNPANVRVHEETTGPEILAQSGGRIGAFVCGVGTGGTITGVGKFLKRVQPSARVVLADPVGSQLAAWVESGTLSGNGSYDVEGIGASRPSGIFDRSVVDVAERVSDAESFAMARRLVVEEGLLVGGSAGTAVVAALRVAARDDLDGPVVALLPDSWDRYRSKPWMQP